MVWTSGQASTWVSTFNHAAMDFTSWTSTLHSNFHRTDTYLTHWHTTFYNTWHTYKY